LYFLCPPLGYKADSIEIKLMSKNLKERGRVEMPGIKSRRITVTMETPGKKKGIVIRHLLKEKVKRREEELESYGKKSKG